MSAREGGGGGLANADVCVNFACKRPNFADVGGAGGGGGKKWQNFGNVLYGWPLTYTKLCLLMLSKNVNSSLSLWPDNSQKSHCVL